MKDNRHLKHKIVSMLKENTGVHFLDSGGAYGRNWERNQGRKFWDEPSCQVDVSGKEDGTIGEILISYNLSHYLLNFLDLNETTRKLNNEFNRFIDKPDNQEKCWLELMEDFAEELKENGRVSLWNTFNSYNYDNLLSQVIQGTWLVVKEYSEEYVILQIHNGCDVRGGYTRPYIFHVPEPNYFHLAQFDVYAGCNGIKFNPKQETLPIPNLSLSPYCQNNWSSDDSGYHFYFDGCSSDEKPFAEYSRFDPETEKLICKECGGEIVFNVVEGY
jgi:hypothetical protein